MTIDDLARTPEACTLPTAERPLRLDLTAREADCCSFFDFTVTPETVADGETLTLDIEVPAQYADVLDAITTRASSVWAS